MISACFQFSSISSVPFCGAMSCSVCAACYANLSIGNLVKQSQGSWVVDSAQLAKLLQLASADSGLEESNKDSNASLSFAASIAHAYSKATEFLLAPNNRHVLLLSILAFSFALLAVICLLALCVLRCCATTRAHADRRADYKYSPLAARANGSLAPTSSSTSDETTTVLLGPEDNLPARTLRPNPSSRYSPTHPSAPPPPTQKFSSPGLSVNFHRNRVKPQPPAAKRGNGLSSSPLEFPVNDTESEETSDSDQVYFDSASLHRLNTVPLFSSEKPLNQTDQKQKPERTSNAASAGFRMDMSRMEIGNGSANLISLSPAHETSSAGRSKQPVRASGVSFPFRMARAGSSSNGVSHDAFANGNSTRRGGKVVDMDALGTRAPLPVPLLRPVDTRT